ncbi:hypothetical protein BO71DRAFT_70659 [Aspergillus ellipticus CBS 707.79]|uniref:Uncharacterized protein n=1 Tax=Aspergillus ellipticus CBS 707.79 TaxID=1448320 RepID=A0A319DLC9_9EURO|nr:hypothetical protein BO71DRAFT_70659 [Aspergillus ellipticus CBS 707.79]
MSRTDELRHGRSRSPVSMRSVGRGKRIPPDLPRLHLRRSISRITDLWSGYSGRRWWLWWCPDSRAGRVRGVTTTNYLLTTSTTKYYCLRDKLTEVHSTP